MSQNMESMVDEVTINHVYNRYIELLQQDKNATIEQVFKEEPLASRLCESSSNE